MDLMLSLGLSICSPAVWSSGAFVPSNAETATLLAALTGSYTRTLKQAWDDAIGALKASGAWEDFDVLYPIGAIPGVAAGNAADSKLNWKDPSNFALVEVNSPTHGSGYWQGDGASSRLRTQWTPSTHGVKYIQDDASVWLWSETDSQSASSDTGNASAAPASQIYCRYTDGKMYARVNGVPNSSGAVAASTGLFVAQRRAANDVRGFRNGTQVFADTEASTGLPTQEQWICGANSNSFSARRLLLAAWAASQTGREAGSSTIFQTLFTAAGTI
jgi:hypothetical protein